MGSLSRASPQEFKRALEAASDSLERFQAGERVDHGIVGHLVLF